MENQNSQKLLFHPLISSSTQNREEILSRQRIKLLTYNFFLRPPPIKTNSDDYKEERLIDFFEYLPDYDIICFQEIFGAFHDRKKKMIKAAKENGYLYYLSSKSPSFFSKFLIDGGLLLISRFPIIDNKYITYDYGVMSDGMSQKGAIYAKIKIKDYYLCLFSTHLQASYYDSGNSLWNFTIETRTKQTEDLINFIYDTIYNLDKNDLSKCIFIVCGDFNIDAYDYKNAREKYNLPKVKFTEYEIFKKKLEKLGKCIDLIENKFHTHPFTFGVNDAEHDQVLTGKEDYNSFQALDYIWEIIPDFSLPIYNKNIIPDVEKEINGNIDNNIENNIDNNEDNNIFDDNEKLLNKEINNNKSSLRKLFVCYDTPKIEEFLIKNRPYQQLSDHFGVSVELAYGIESQYYEKIKNNEIHDIKEEKKESEKIEEKEKEKKDIDINKDNNDNENIDNNKEKNNDNNLM
jgi:endonuclease/exonuclease/phosphatase family metal-dependent hydrolase